MSFLQNKKKNDFIFKFMSIALRKYIRSIIKEISGMQHVQKNKMIDEDEDLDEDDMFDESIGVAGIQGVVGPVGVNSQDLEGPAARGERGKKKKPGWT